MCFFSLQKPKQAVPVKIIQEETPMDLQDEIKAVGENSRTEGSFNKFINRNRG